MKPGLKRQLSFVLTLIICVGVVFVAMAWLAGAFRHGQIAPGKIPSQTARYEGPAYEVRLVERPAQLTLVGSIESEVRTTIAARMSANIVEINAVAGKTVRKGDVLARLDDRDTQARVGQAREVLRSAEAARDQAKRELERTIPLVESRAASLRELEDWKSRAAITSADVSRAQQALDEALVRQSDTVIAAPFDGIIIDRYMESGDLASAGKPLLDMYDPSRLRLEAVARESDIGILSQLRKGSKPLTVSVPSLRSERQGLIEQIVPAADPQSRSFLVKVHLSDTADLYPGMFGRLQVPMSAGKYVEIPRDAVREVGQIAMVDLVMPEGLTSRAVRLGEERGDRVEVLAGLEQGDKVALAVRK